MNDIKKRQDQIRKGLSQKKIGGCFNPANLYPDVKEFERSDFRNVATRLRNLPHWELDGFSYFVTFGVSARSPVSVPPDFSSNSAAAILEQLIWLRHGEYYRLEAYVIMPNHVHILFTPLPDYRIGPVMRQIKGVSSLEINRFLGRKGSFWQPDSFDHIIRNHEDWMDKFDYIHQNPVKAGLVAKPEDYPFSSAVTMYSDMVIIEEEISG